MENWRNYISEQNEINIFKDNLSSIVEELLLKLDITSDMGVYNLKYFLDGYAEDQLSQYIEFVKTMPELKPAYNEEVKPLLDLANKMIKYFESFSEIYNKTYFNHNALSKLIAGISTDEYMRGTIAGRLYAGGANPDIIPSLKDFRNILGHTEDNQETIEEAGKCQKGYKTHSTRKTKKMFGKTYRNCVKAEGKEK
jgi:hypothetical protein